MNQPLIFLVLLMPLSLAMACQNNSQTQCQLPTCVWLNSTCIGSTDLCSPLTFWSNQTKDCQPCSILGKDCSIFCPSYYYNANTSTCNSCYSLDSNCLSCTLVACLTCNSGFQPSSIFPTRCVPTPCLIIDCLVCGSNNTCLTCRSYSNNSSGNFSNYNSTLGYTYQNYSSNYSQVNVSQCGSICSVQNCMICYSQSSCSVCNNHYYVSNDSKTCILKCSDLNCLTCLNYTNCITCVNGYKLNPSTGLCEIQCLVDNCLLCPYSTVCLVCVSGYQPTTIYNYCSVICSLQFCSKCDSQSKCTQCQIGYQLSSDGTQCLPTICKISSCLRCATSTTCAQCNSISYLNSKQSTCIGNCLSSISNCQICESNTTCLACQIGYALSPLSTVCSVICSIPYCYTCKTTTTCLFCNANYVLSTNQQQCILNCGVPYCQSCAGLTTCQTCQTGYVLMNFGANCFPPCSPGLYLSTTNITPTCQVCSVAIIFCQTCTFSTNTVICNTCLYGYILNSDICKPCNQTLPNCLSCSSSLICQQCDSGYVPITLQTTVTCAQVGNCQVPNCQLCSFGNSSICVSCYIQYEISSNGTSCDPIGCISTQYYDASIGSCVCPFGTYMSNNICTYCSFSNCVTCNQVGCTSCPSGYFSAEGLCLNCNRNCIKCSSSSSCLSCKYGYSLQSGICIARLSSVVYFSSIIICPPGCSQCAQSNQQIYCISASVTYYFNPIGTVQSCNTNCLTCASTDPSICTSCFGFSLLISGQCLGCSDEFALSCPGNLNYSTSCISGYSPFNGTCQACSAYCKTCGNSGPGLCDDSGCNQGYIVLLGTKNCTICFSGCSQCSPADPSQCLKCSSSDYRNNVSVCSPCPVQCLSCISDTICTSCITGYYYYNNFCYLQVSFPCSQQVQNSCISCYYGYSLVAGFCLLDLSCNTSSTCYSCPKNYYLSNKNCYSCSTDSSCDYCNPLNPSFCLTCTVGYYVTNNTCTQCSQALIGCSQCSSALLCTQAQTGFYLDTNAGGYYTGKVKQCTPYCTSCSSADSCDICASEYIRIGSVCIYQLNIQGVITLAPNSISSWFTSTNDNNVNLAQALLHSNQISFAIAYCAGYSTLDSILLTGMKSGSIIVDFTLGVDPSQDPSTFSNNFQNKVYSEFPGFTVVSLSTTNNGFESTSSSNSSPNLGLILGVSIPLGLIFIILVIIFVCWSVKRPPPVEQMQLSDQFSKQETKL